MKTLKLFITVLSAFLFFSCSGFNLEDNRGSIALRMPEGNIQTRSITTREPEILTYKVSLLDKDEKEIAMKGGTPGSEIVFDELNEGSYIVLCRCFIKKDVTEVLYASAQDIADVKAGQTASVTLYLELEPEFIPEDPLPEETPEKEPEEIQTPEEEDKDPEDDTQVTDPKEPGDSQVTEPKEEEQKPGDSQVTDPKEPGDSQVTEPKDEEIEPPAFLSEFDLEKAIACSDWSTLQSSIAELSYGSTQVFTLSGDYTADSMINMDKGCKILLLATGTTKINVTKEDCFTIVSDELIVYGTKEASITFTGEASGSVFNVSGSSANLTVAGNVEFKDFKNTFNNGGGAIFLVDGQCTICGGVTFTNCAASNSDGGAVCVFGGKLFISGEDKDYPVTFNKCSAAGNGGAIYIKQGGETDIASIMNVQFGSEENTCGTNGRDICIYSDNEPYIEGYLGSDTGKIDIYSKNVFVFSSYIETTSEIYITFNAETFNTASTSSTAILDTNYDPYSEDLRSLIYVKAEGDETWKHVSEAGIITAD